LENKRSLNKKISVIIPTYQAAKFLPSLIKDIQNQTINITEILVIDSSSTDDSLKIARQLGVRTLVVPKKEFNHGLTRTIAAQQSIGDIIVFLTQDVRIRDKKALEILISYIRDDIVLAYGRQVAPPNFDKLPALHRLFNYGKETKIFSYNDRYIFGIKTAFASNSFAAYKREALEEIGWFPKLPASEDIYAAASFLKRGYRIAYVAEACVWHAHKFHVLRELKRYYNIGKFFAQEAWILNEFGIAENEGRKYLTFALKHLYSYPHLLIVFFIQSFIRYFGYRLGLNLEKILSQKSFNNDLLNRAYSKTIKRNLM